MEATSTSAPSSPRLGAETASPPAAKPKSPPLRRKTSHSVIERRRREKINERLIKLQETVPACRLEAEEMLRVKMEAAAGRKKKGARMTSEERECIIEGKVKHTMVLEKLCIISHTVDYMEELRTQLEAYRRLCRCSPPASLTKPLPEAQAEALRAHIASAHGGLAELDALPESTAGELGETIKPLVTAVKRKRHWGSNREPRPEPPHKARRRKSSPSEPDDAPSNVGVGLSRSARTAAVAARAAMLDGGSESGSNVEPDLDGSVASGTDSDSEDELAFDSPAPSSATATGGGMLPISALYSSHTTSASTPNASLLKTASLARRRFTDAGLTPDPSGSTSIETLHACGHSHSMGGPTLPWQPGATHHSHANVHAKPHLWGLPNTARSTLPACWSPTNSTAPGLRLAPLRAPSSQTDTNECFGPPVSLRPRSLSPNGTSTSQGKLHLLAQLSSPSNPPALGRRL